MDDQSTQDSFGREKEYTLNPRSHVKGYCRDKGTRSYVGNS